MKNLIFIAAIICGINAFAGDIDINGDFKKIKGDMPLGWKQNKGSWAKPFGKAEMVENVVKITNTDATKRTDFYSLKSIPVKVGDKVTLTVKLKGKGTAGIGIYIYGDKGKWCTSSYKNTKLKPETNEVRVTVIVKDNVKDGKVITVAKVCKVVLQTIKPSAEITFESVKVEVIPAK
jgi:hypothetical protein